MTTQRTRLSADLHRLPDVTLVHLRGNDWRPKYRKRQGDVQEWAAALHLAGEHARFEPLFTEPTCLRVKVYYCTARVPDVDNVLAALKPLIDLLEPLHTYRGGTRGYVGWIANDRLIQSVTVERFTDASRAPLTQLRMEAVG